LKGDTLLTEKRPESLVADVLNHPLSHQVVGQLGERPGREGLAVIGRMAESDLLDLGPLGGAELGRPAPAYLGAKESKPSRLKLWITSLTRSSEVKAILAMAGTSMCWALHSTIWALRHRTTEPEPRRMIERSLFPSSLEMSLTATRSAMPHFARPGAQSGGRGPGAWPVTALVPCQASFASARMAQTRRSGAVQLGAIPCGSVASELQSP
jgi:hypothetical protein